MCGHVVQVENEFIYLLNVYDLNRSYNISIIWIFGSISLDCRYSQAVAKSTCLAQCLQPPMQSKRYNNQASNWPNHPSFVKNIEIKYNKIFFCAEIEAANQCGRYELKLHSTQSCHHPRLTRPRSRFPALREGVLVLDGKGCNIISRGDLANRRTTWQGRG